MIFYKTLKKYKYQLMDDYSLNIDIHPENDIIEPPMPRETYIRLEKSGTLTIYKFYAWDGPSGPTKDTKNFMRGSLVHDALYQLIRGHCIDQKFREYADDLLRAICIEDGMSRFRAWYVYMGVRIFGGIAIKPRKVDEFEILTAP
jgi:hypothetical protein